MEFFGVWLRLYVFIELCFVFENVSFFYGDGVLILMGFSFEVVFKLLMLIVGLFGIGKFIFGCLVVGIDVLLLGCVLFGGLDIFDYELNDVCSKIVYIL